MAEGREHRVVGNNEGQKRAGRVYVVAVDWRFADLTDRSKIEVESEPIQ